MALVPALDDPGVHNATGAYIAANAMTQGVSHFWYAYTSEVSGGAPLFYTDSLAPFVSMSYTPNGPIVANQIVPEPGTVGLILAGLVLCPRNT